MLLNKNRRPERISQKRKGSLKYNSGSLYLFNKRLQQEALHLHVVAALFATFLIFI